MKKIIQTLITSVIIILLLSACTSSPATIMDAPAIPSETISYNGTTDDYPTTEHSDFERQLALLHEFATMLNTGGVELSDLRITRVWGHSYRGLGILNDRTGEPMQVSFDVSFFNEADMHDEALIAELLAYTGIKEDNISFSAWQGVVPFVYYEFLLVNQAVYAFAKPYLLLHEFATNINSGTTYYHEVTVTALMDQGKFSDITWGDVHSPRFEVGLSTSELVNNQELISEILEYTGIDSDDIVFTQMAIDSRYIEADFLRVNAELMELYLQWNRLTEFMAMAQIRTVRRNLLMDSVMSSMSPANRGTIPFPMGDGTMWDGFPFTLSLSHQRHLDNEEFINNLLEFTGIAPEDIEISLGGRFYFGGPPRLTQSQQKIRESLEAFIDRANAPFWEDRYANDPVIVRMYVPDTWENMSDKFILWLYDMESLEQGLKEEIAEYTGVDLELLDFRLAE